MLNNINNMQRSSPQADITNSEKWANIKNEKREKKIVETQQMMEVYRRA